MPEERAISADDHMDLKVLPPSLRWDRLPAALAARAPKVVATPEGNFWEAEGKRWGHSGLLDRTGIPNVFRRAGVEDDGFRAANPALRLADMDRDGVYAQVIYGPLMGIPIEDPELELACLRVYNDWGAEFNRANPNRLSLLPILPAHDPATAAEELCRVAKHGHRGAIFGLFQSDTPYFDDAWEPLWADAEETGLPISFHIGKGTHALTIELGTWRHPAYVAVAPMQMDEAVVSMVFNGVFERQPNLRLVMGECGIGWVPYILQRMDHAFERYGKIIPNLAIRTEPSELFRRQMYVTFQDDPVGVRLIPDIGEDNVMWASDYPHPEGTFPNSRRVIEESFGDLPAAVRRKIVGENAARLYRIR
jgi:predicted TIM-barrel fold metal-dependent hydrolase